MERTGRSDLDQQVGRSNPVATTNSIPSHTASVLLNLGRVRRVDRELVVTKRLQRTFSQETPKNRYFVETLVLECDIGMHEKLFK